MSRTSQTNSILSLNYPEWIIFALPVVPLQTVCTIIGYRSSKDVPLTRDTFLHLRKRRYRCSCGKRFFEKNHLIPRYYRIIGRLLDEIIFAFKKIVSAKEIGCRFIVSAITAMRYFNYFNKKINYIQTTYLMPKKWAIGYILGTHYAKYRLKLKAQV